MNSESFTRQRLLGAMSATAAAGCRIRSKESHEYEKALAYL